MPRGERAACLGREPRACIAAPLRPVLRRPTGALRIPTSADMGMWVRADRSAAPPNGAYRGPMPTLKTTPRSCIERCWYGAENSDVFKPGAFEAGGCYEAEVFHNRCDQAPRSGVCSSGFYCARTHTHTHTHTHARTHTYSTYAHREDKLPAGERTAVPFRSLMREEAADVFRRYAELPPSERSCY